MQQKFIEKQPASVSRRGSLLPHDNARPHASKIVIQKLDDLGYDTPPDHTAYSPDLFPTIHHFFNHLGGHVKDKKRPR